jgi:hypothetical protein
LQGGGRLQVVDETRRLKVRRLEVVVGEWWWVKQGSTHQTMSHYHHRHLF